MRLIATLATKLRVPPPPHRRFIDARQMRGFDHDVMMQRSDNKDDRQVRHDRALSLGGSPGTFPKAARFCKWPRPPDT